MRLRNRTIIVTGAGRNIGEGIAHTLADEGARVAVVDIIRERAESVAAAIKRRPPGCGAPRRLRRHEQRGRSGDGGRRRRRVGRHLRPREQRRRRRPQGHPGHRRGRVGPGHQRHPQERLPRLKIRRPAHGRPGQRWTHHQHRLHLRACGTHGGAVAYPSAKAGVYNLSRSLAIQLAPHGIRVNTVTPNRILTEAEPGAPPRTWQVANLVGRQGTPQDVAAAVAFLASDDADFITGSDITVDGGVRAG